MMGKREIPKWQILRIIIVMLIMSILTIETAYQVQAYSLTEDKREGNRVILSSQSRNSEEMHVIIGAPTTVDIGDPIPVAVAGFRDAKAVYIKPIAVTIKMYSVDKDTIGTESEKETLISTKKGHYYEDQWLVDSESSAIVRLNDYIYQTTFPPIKSEMVIKIEASMDWKSPWNEIFTSSNYIYINLDKWRNYTQYLQTNSNEIKANLTGGFNEDVNLAISTLTDVSNNFADIIESLETEVFLKDLKTNDPSDLHFYLLNITSIVDPNNPNSYISQMDDTHIFKNGLTKKQYYISLLREINEAFVESLKILDRKGIPYIITSVNYTYTDTIDGYAKDNGGDLDADWDDENLNDTSFEFLLEGTAWSGHPDLFHQNLTFSFDAPSTGYTSFKTLLEQYNAQILTSSIKNDEIWKNDGSIPTNSRLQYINAYSGYVKLWRNDSGTLIPLEEGSEFSVDGSSGVTLLTDLSGSQLVMEVERPGGWRKSNKGIIVNLMGDIFPVLSRFYYVPRGLADPIPETDFNEYYIDPSDPNFIPPPIKLCELAHDPNTGEVNKNWLESPTPAGKSVDDIHYVNITDYFFFIIGLTSGVPYWINTIFKPFSRLVYDTNVYDGDSYNAEWNENDLNEYAKQFFGEITDPSGNPVNISMFALFDMMLGLTGDFGGGGVIPHEIRSEDWFYKNSWGDWIDAFFNGTRLDGTDPDHYGMVQGHSEGWTFRYIDRDVSDVSTTELPAEYQLAPFQGPSDYTPVGIMTLGNIVFAQNSLKNTSAGFGYVYGLIYNLYRRTYDAIKSNLLRLQREMLQNNNTHAYHNISADIMTLDKAWDDLDMKTIDKIHSKLRDYLRNPNNPYTAEGGRSYLSNKISNVQNQLNDAITRLQKYESTASRIDDEISGTGYDVQKLGILDSVIEFLNGTVKPWIENLNITINSKIDDLSSGFNNFVDNMVLQMGYLAKNFTGEGGLLYNITDKISKGLNTTAEKFNPGYALRDKIKNFFSVVADISGAAVDVTATLSASGVVKLFKNQLKAFVKWIINKVGGFIGDGMLNTITKVLNMLGMNYETALKTLSSNLYKGLDTVRVGLDNAFTRILTGLSNAGEAFKTAVGNIADVLHLIMHQITKSGLMIIQSMITNLKTIQSVLDQINDIINDIVDKITGIYNKIKDTFKQVGEFIAQIVGTSLGRVKDIMKNVSGTIVDRLKFAAEQIQNHSAFVKIEHVYNKVKEALLRFASIQYEAQYGTIDKSTMLQEADAMKPLSEINSADTGFYVYQMGDAFAENLYYIVIYNGKLVNPDDIQFKIRRFVDLSEYGGEGNAILEAYPIVHHFRTSESDPSTEVPGIYYVNISEGDRLQWYKENSTEPYVVAAATSDDYLTIFNCTIENTKEYSTPIDSYSVVKTRLYTREYINDAFPVIDIAGYSAGSGEPIEINADKGAQIFDITIYNKMWSNPNVTVDLVITTAVEKGDVSFDGGTAIAQIRFNNVPLYPEGKTDMAVSWNVGKYTPSGNFWLMVSVTEVNGDQSSIVVPVKVEKSNVFGAIVSSLFTSGWGWGLIAIIGAGIYFLYMTLTKSKKKTIPLISISK